MRLGPWEIAAVVAIALLIFGPSKLPKLGSSIAEFFKNFKKGVKEVDQETDEVKKKVGLS